MGDKVQVNRTPLKGHIVDIVKNIEDVTWNSNGSPELIVVQFEDSISKYPVYMLKRIK